MDPDNGTLQCPTCHLEYFTKGLLVWSPPIAILSWIFFQLQGKTEMIQITPVLDRLRNKEDMPKHVRYLFGCYSLVPIFRPKYNSLRYDMFCPMPPKEVPFGDDTAFRIFRHDDDIPASSSGGVISFHATGEEEDGPINFWRLPVPPTVVLYLFLREAHKIETITDSTRPEIQLGRDIYAKLSKVSNKLQRREAKFAPKPPPKTPSAVSQHASISVERSKSSDADTGPLHSTQDSKSRRKPPVESISEGPKSRAFPESKASGLLSPDRE
ncbi:hypothetical protein B0H14DRAFT_3125468, partial [Mycena olivaceomarginata]